MLFPRTLEELFRRASDKLEIEAKRIFMLDGVEVDNVLFLRYLPIFIDPRVVTLDMFMFYNVIKFSCEAYFLRNYLCNKLLKCLVVTEKKGLRKKG